MKTGSDLVANGPNYPSSTRSFFWCVLRAYLLLYLSMCP